MLNFHDLKNLGYGPDKSAVSESLSRYMYSGRCDIRSLHLTIPSILRQLISDTLLIHVFSI